VLLALSGLQHSGMVRPAFKALVTRWVPEALERTVEIVMASLTVWVLCLVCVQHCAGFLVSEGSYLVPTTPR
jgi:hypothetical protein